jgi:hypothetical protein
LKLTHVYEGTRRLADNIISLPSSLRNNAGIWSAGSWDG